MNEAVISITDQPGPRLLMANEFHPAGSHEFAPQEPQSFIRRLTKEQCSLLASDRVPTNHLTAFITFGDGFFDRPMGAYFDLYPGKDSIRPNASFALFFKQKVDGKLKISLVFYTRFLVISYGSEKNKYAIQARELCKQLDVIPGHEELKKYAFEAMQKLFPRDSVVSLSRTGVAWRQHPPPRFGLFIEPKFRRGGYSYFPYILLKMQARGGWQTPAWFRRNTIHGIYNTRGCWMLMRNFVWNRPDENLGDTFFNLTKKCYLKHNPIIERLISQRELAVQARDRRAQLRIDEIKEREYEKLARCVEYYLPMNHPVQNMTSENVAYWFLARSRNFSYLHFIHTFIGIRYNHENRNIPYYTPSVPTTEGKMGDNCWKETSGAEMAKLFYPTIFNDNKKNDFTKPWAYAYLFQCTDGRFTPDPGDQKTFK